MTVKQTNKKQPQTFLLCFSKKCWHQATPNNISFLNTNDKAWTNAPDIGRLALAGCIAGAPAVGKMEWVGIC